MPYTLLLVDDDGEFRTEFRDFLDDYTVVEARDGDEALRILKKPNEIDLVILDQMMPGARGTVVLREIKRIAPTLGIVILTGHSSKDVAIEALKGRADEYLEKPLDPAGARTVIERLLAGREGIEDVSAQDLAGKIERVKRFVLRNCQRKVSLRDAAATACLSPKYLSRAFKELTGRGFNEFYLRAKVERAKELLRDTRLTVEQLSDRLAYQNAESFVRIFRKYAGRTPAKYRSGENRRNAARPRGTGERKRAGRTPAKCRSGKKSPGRGKAARNRGTVSR
jgi:YesN/AraC family two-component response regulator